MNLLLGLLRANQIFPRLWAGIKWALTGLWKLCSLPVQAPLVAFVALAWLYAQSQKQALYTKEVQVQSLSDSLAAVSRDRETFVQLSKTAEHERDSLRLDYQNYRLYLRTLVGDNLQSELNREFDRQLEAANSEALHPDRSRGTHGAGVQAKGDQW